jgi:Fe-S cluster biosynthesis and repair protein YggX
MSKGASRAPQEMRMDFAVFPETNCQGLFNQIHKKATKKCQKQILAPDTFADGLFAPA